MHGRSDIFDVIEAVVCVNSLRGRSKHRGLQGCSMNVVGVAHVYLSSAN